MVYQCDVRSSLGEFVPALDSDFFFGGGHLIDSQKHVASETQLLPGHNLVPSENACASEQFLPVRFEIVFELPGFSQRSDKKDHRSLPAPNSLRILAEIQ